MLASWALIVLTYHYPVVAYFANKDMCEEARAQVVQMIAEVPFGKANSSRCLLMGPGAAPNNTKTN